MTALVLTLDITTSPQVVEDSKIGQGCKTSSDQSPRSVFTPVFIHINTSVSLTNSGSKHTAAFPGLDYSFELGKRARCRQMRQDDCTSKSEYGTTSNDLHKVDLSKAKLLY